VCDHDPRRSLDVLELRVWTSPLKPDTSDERMSWWHRGRNQSRRKFGDEFKRDAAALVIDTGRPIAQVAREIGVYESSLGRWVAQERANRGETDDLSTAERERLRELECEVADLRMERDLLR
jgi:transposase